MVYIYNIRVFTREENMLKTVLKSAVCAVIFLSVGGVADARLNVDAADGDLGGLSSSPWQNGNTASAGVGGTSAPAVADTIAGPGDTAAPITGNRVPLPKFVGENTTWTKAQGQKSIAPEVNIANMLIMTDHLRKLGYKIPPEFDEFIRKSPENLRKKIMGALQDIRDSSDNKSDIVEYSFARVLSVVEKQTGFDLTNIFDTTFNLLDEGPK